jgi:hypothetical protein
LANAGFSSAKYVASAAISSALSPVACGFITPLVSVSMIDAWDFAEITFRAGAPATSAS